MAARYALQSFWFHNTSTGHEEFVGIGATRDSVSDQAVVQHPEQFGTAALTSLTGLDPKTEQYLKLHPKGPGEGIL
jgi:hypothetical protein